jgi:hypothetical protein
MKKPGVGICLPSHTWLQSFCSLCTFPFRRYSYPIHLSIHCYTVRAQEALLLCHVSKIYSWLLIPILVGETFSCSEGCRRPLTEMKGWHFLKSKGADLRGHWGVVTVINEIFDRDRMSDGRSQWSRGLRHELSSPARTLGSWVRIPLKAWIFMCVYSVFV